MGKNILIFSDGTGQFGGLKPDQRLSNIYKMYRAMRPGPDSPINPKDQVAFYDPGLGAGETQGITLRRVRNGLEAAVGTGIDDNVIDCYEAIISYYEPGDRVLLFGFSRGAYTARSVAGVMNLCGVPTRMPDGSPIPRYGPTLRKIAADAVKYVYNHGAGRPRAEQPFFHQREEKGRRFRARYGSAVAGAKEDVQGNVQPDFIGVFDTVAALGNKLLSYALFTGIAALVLAALVAGFQEWTWVFWILVVLLVAAFARYLKIRIEQWKYFSPDPNRPLRLSKPRDWYAIWKNGHRAVWNREHYDRYLDSDVQHARHALAIDEGRKDFPRVLWGSTQEAEKTVTRTPPWLKQIWFAGCHSDVGGSYPEPESRLSDIALEWMLSELHECVPSVQVRQELLHTYPDVRGLQHDETVMFKLFGWKLHWARARREVDVNAVLHPSVYQRLEAGNVPQVDTVAPYRPPSLENHAEAKRWFSREVP